MIALALVAVLAGSALGGAEMRTKMPGVEPVFADGPGLNDPDFERWLSEQRTARAVIELPFSIWRKPQRRGAIGVHAQPPAQLLRFDDTALGIALDDRLRTACKDAERCALWLSGRFGGSLSASDGDVFSVHAVHGLVNPKATLYAQALRGAECLAIRTLTPIHCARGPKRCEKCRAAAQEPARPKLLDVCPYGDHARPTIEVQREGKSSYRPYDVLRVFTDAEEAQAFAQTHGITDVK